MAKQIGKVVQVIGPVVDVRFEAGKEMPNIYDPGSAAAHG
jgi:F0F1-type ATP synthase beta subunit